MAVETTHMLRFRFYTAGAAQCFGEGYGLFRVEGDPPVNAPRYIDDRWCVDIGPTDLDMGWAPLEIVDGVAVVATYPY